MADSITLGAPASLKVILRCVDPGDKGRRVDIAEELVAQQSLTTRHIVEAGKFVDGLLADPARSDADLKGMLKRLAGPSWGASFQFGSDDASARLYLQSLQKALKQRAA